MPEIAGVVGFREPNPGDRKASAAEILVTVGEDHLNYQTENAQIIASAPVRSFKPIAIWPTS